MTNLKLRFSESGPGSVQIPPKSIFLFKSLNFYEYLKMLQISFCPQNLNYLGYAAESFGLFNSQWDYEMVKISRI